jgi:hypothetical protein
MARSLLDPVQVRILRGPAAEATPASISVA